MEWNMDKTKPICPQICDVLCGCIASGELKPQQKIPSVREIAVAAEVNPNTVQKALDTLEAEGILTSVRGVGWFVTDNTARASKTLERLKSDKTRAFFADMAALGLSVADIKAYVKEWNV